MILFRRALVVALSGFVPLAWGAPAAQTTVYRQWRLVYHTSLQGSTDWRFGGLVAPSRDQAWALGHTLKAGRSGDILEHWNGSRWRMTAVPGINLMPVAVAASGPSKAV